ncbi:MAG: hypothetical protein AABY22_03835 [Nanoarchaeota archaeon]
MVKNKKSIKIGREKVRVKFGFPDKWEWILLAFAIGFFLWANELQNKVLDLGLGYEVTILSGTTYPAMNLFWFAITLYHLFLFGVITRSITSRKHKTTHYYADFVFGFIGILGIFFLVTGAVSGIYFEPNEPLPFFFNVTQINFYHIGGILLQLITILWFMFTN